MSADWPRLFALAAKLDKAVEIDSYPDRQDLDVELLRLAQRAGTRISLGIDAHHPWQLQFIELGLAGAIQAGHRQKAHSQFHEPGAVAFLGQDVEQTLTDQLYEKID